eukprot:m.324533 g.324533  ORF g.324533 m.324533 type:complete len:227 (-) comp20373_c0_seq24:159-839(-)
MSKLTFYIGTSYGSFGQCHTRATIVSSLYLLLRIREQLPLSSIELSRCASSAGAGFFLNFGAYFPPQILSLAQSQNSSAALNSACKVNAVEHGLPVETCFFPENAVAHVQTPVFALQSRFDTWQLPHIAKIAVSNVSGVESYGHLIATRMAPLIYAAISTNASGIRHAVWLSSCLTHGLAVDALWVDARTDNMSEWRSFQQWQTGALDTSQRAWIDCATYACDASC